MSESIPSAPGGSIRQTLSWMFRPLAFMRDARGRCGPVFSLRVLGWARIVLLSRPADIAKVFAAEGEALHTGAANDLMSPVLGARSVFVLDGPDHRAARRAIINALGVSNMRDAATQALRITPDILDTRCDGARHDVHRMFGEISLAIMLHLLFRRSGPDRIAVYYRHFRFILGRISAMLVYLRPLQANIGPGSPGWWLARDMTRFHATIQEDLDRAASAEPDCVAVRVASNLANAGMSDRALVREQIVSLMLAGHDTVASALSWALLWLLRDPDLLARVRAEIGAAAPLDLSTLETLPLLGAVCNEALRLVPTVELVSRKAMVDFPLGDVVVPAGTLVSPCTYLAHREPGLYPDPDTFRPERFLERDYGPAEFIPFGGGLRRCLGAQLGLLEMRAVLAVALTTVDFDVPGLARIDGVRRNVTIAPSPRMKARVRRRVTPTRNPG